LVLLDREAVSVFSASWGGWSMKRTRLHNGQGTTAALLLARMAAIASLIVVLVPVLDAAESGTQLGRAIPRGSSVPDCNAATSLFATTIVHVQPLRPHPYGDVRAALAFADSADNRGHRVLATVHDVGS
jgi:hypothetical protein